MEKKIIPGENVFSEGTDLSLLGSVTVRKDGNDNKVDVQVKNVPDLGGVAFVMKSDRFTGDHMRTNVNHLIETNWGVK